MNMIMRVLKWLAVSAIPVLLVATNLRIAINSQALYRYDFEHFGIPSVTGLSLSQLDTVGAQMIDYFNSSANSPQVIVSSGQKQFPIYSERELVHLADVKKLVDLDYRVQLVTLIVALAGVAAGLAMRKRAGLQAVRDILVWGSLAVFGVIACLLAWSLVDFDQLFIVFHLIGFPNDFWILDPSQHYLIMMFPEGFFYTTVLLILAATVIEAVIIGAAGLCVRKRLHSAGTAAAASAGGASAAGAGNRGDASA